jgi:hypothetical protein
MIGGPLAPIPDGRRLCPECLYLAGCVSWDVPDGWTREGSVTREASAEEHPTKPREQLALF